MSTPLNPTSFVLQTVSSLWENLPTIIMGGIFFSLLCAPAFVLFALGWVSGALILAPLLVVPAWGALMRMQKTLLAGRTTSVAEMGRALMHYWRPNFRLGVIGILPLFLLYQLLPALAAPSVNRVVWLAFYLLLLLVALIAAIYLYALPLTVMVDLPTLVLLRNSAILASRHAGNTVGLLSMGVLFALAVIYLTPAFLFVLPTIYALFITNHCRMVAGLATEN